LLANRFAHEASAEGFGSVGNASGGGGEGRSSCSSTDHSSSAKDALVLAQ
jgi:hypothetical protein